MDLPTLAPKGAVSPVAGDSVDAPIGWGAFSLNRASRNSVVYWRDEQTACRLAPQASADSGSNELALKEERRKLLMALDKIRRNFMQQVQ